MHVIVLGAGASHPYGFPLGRQLKQFIQDSTSQPDTQRILKSLNIGSEITDGLARLLRLSDFGTVDELLENKPRYREAASSLIAYKILELENENNLFPSRDWYPIFIRRLKLDETDRIARNIAVITLNYDRSLEHYLTEHIRLNITESREQTALENLKSLKILHAHGSIGDHSDIPYGASSTNLELIKSAAANIRIISDRLEDSESFIEAASILEKATTLTILGFGYHARTLETLFAKLDPTKTKVIGSTFGLDQFMSSKAKAFFKDQINLVSNGASTVMEISPQFTMGPINIDPRLNPTGNGKARIEQPSGGES